MTMSPGTVTYEATYTVADIKRVVDRFAADYAMIGQATELQTREQAAKLVSEIKTYAEEEYLREIDVTLFDAAGKELQAAQYKVSESASGWINQQPGNNIWPATPGGILRVTLTLNKRWYALTQTQRDEFNRRYGLDWSSRATDLTHQTLIRQFDRRYVSNGYGMEKNIFKAI
jgi:ABC-type uncharacterized transport system auxiliary subunit